MLEPSDRARDAVQRVRALVNETIIPAEARLLGRGFRESLPELGKLRDAARVAGVWAPYLPRDLGGMGLSLYDYAFVAEELGRSPLGHWSVNAQAPDVGNIELLLGHAGEELRKRWLEPLAAGRIRSCFSMTEPEHAGSNPVWMSTRAEK